VIEQDLFLRHELVEVEAERAFSSNIMNTPGSPNWVAPRTRNSRASIVFPQPALPLTSVGRPRGSPPPVISSRPVIPVGDFGRVAGVGKGGFLFMAAGWRVGICCGREAPETAVVPDRRGGKDQYSQKVPDFWSLNRPVLIRVAW
jgi:hypothetical protein